MGVDSARMYTTLSNCQNGSDQMSVYIVASSEMCGTLGDAKQPLSRTMSLLPRRG
jgi:hypothetical protein